MRSIVIKNFIDLKTGVLYEQGTPFEESDARIKALEGLGFVKAEETKPKRKRKAVEK